MPIDHELKNVDIVGVALYRRITTVLKTRDFGAFDLLMRETDIENTDLSLLVVMLIGASRMPRESLPYRGEFYAGVLGRYTRDRGEREANRAIGHLK